MEITLDMDVAENIKGYVAMGKSSLFISKKLKMSYKNVVLARQALCPEGQPTEGRHGRPGTYNAGCRCTVCVSAATRRYNRNKESRLLRPQDIPHGTMSGYWNWDCRCAPCKVVGSVVNKQRVWTDPATQTRKGEVWNDVECDSVGTYDVTARELALSLGRTIGGVHQKRPAVVREMNLTR